MFVVEMFFGDYDSKEHREFQCHMSVFDELLDLGRKHGWKPMGTIPAKMSYDNWIKAGDFTNDYESINYGYVKTFQSKDALNLANSLEAVLQKVRQGVLRTSQKASPPVISDTMTEAEFEITNRRITDKVLEKFIVFLRAGEFDFTYDD